MKTFEIPNFYRSSYIGKIKALRKNDDPRKKDFAPTTLDFGPVRFHLGRHFGFCYGVENAIEIAYSAIESNPDKRIFMLSQMIHNPTVNMDLEDRGLRFIQDTEGNQITAWDEICSDDIIIIPAFGTTLEIEELLASIGVETQQYNTTCPFVEKVWKTAKKLGDKDYSIIIHGKFSHEETRATFSHSMSESDSIVLKDINEAKVLGSIIKGETSISVFNDKFAERCSPGFDPKTHLKKLGVINQTTMLASDTHEIAEYFKSVMIEVYGEENIADHFADTRDTLCYATNDNQQSTYELLELEADLAIIVGGYNSSNTSHIKELCDSKFKSYFINGQDEILSSHSIHHFDYANKQFQKSDSFIPNKEVVNIVLTSGASCPDAVVESVMDKILGYFPNHESKEAVFERLSSGQS